MKPKWLILIALLIAAGVLVLTANQKQPEKQLPIVKQVARPDAVQIIENNTTSADFWVIDPGVRVGPITPKSTLADLEKAFGEANVKSAQIAGAEGDTYPGVVVYPLAPDQQLEIIWKSEQQKTPGTIIIRGENSKWHTRNGVSLGTSLKTLETLNGGPFIMTGFDWDYGGTVLSWGDEGRLNSIFQKQGSLVLRLEPSERAPQKAREAVLGDGSFSSANPNMQAVRPVVREMVVIFP
ncbi:MAG TPA: hypothetical protein V6C99_05545 [Oculatellaceae cyanobacterium]|jgi:hypothetical protein